MSDHSGTITTHLAPGQPAFNTVQPTGGLVPDNTIPRDPTALIWSQPHQVDRSGYTAPTLNAKNVTYDTAYLIGDSGFGGEFDDTLTFTRRWATKPATRYTYARAAVTYPGWYSEREPSSQNTLVQSTYEYFLVGPEAWCDYASVDEIPIIEETRVTDTNGMDVAILSGFFLNDGGGVLYLTTPTLADYKDLVADDLAITALYSLVMDCNFEDYAGNIVARVTRRVKAK
jgi:hypothetical protein